MNPVNTKLKLSGYLSWVLVLLLVTAGCKKTEVTDNTEFAIYYTGMTDIGPSMNGIIAAPSYIGGMPNNFEIVQITLDGEPYTGSSFEINQDNGGVSIKETTGMSVGLYKLTISCYANGTRYEFKDAVAVNMMKPVPDGITVTPNKLTASYSDVIDANSTVELPTAQVTTDNNHVSIRKYEIAKSDFSKYFAISSTGTISIIRGDLGLLPGKYVLSLKLTTGASGEDEGIFENAIEIDITSKPLGLTYEPASGKLEEESALSGKTSYTSTAPKLKGSLDNVQYTIKNISPATDKIKINAQTGVITVSENHGLTAGQQYKVTVNVKNVYDQAGVDFVDVFELDVVEFIEPIQNFAYQNKNATQAVAFTAGPDAGFKGDEVRFEFVDLPAALQGKVTLNSQGVVSALKGNTIPIGNYTVKVKATNPKGESTALFTLAVVANPNYFTYVRYGNNLNLTPAENYANQFRIAVGVATSGFKSKVPVTDAGVSLTYEIQGIHQSTGTTIDASTGVITIGTINAANCGIFMVTATAGKGTPSEFSVQTPVFFHNSEPIAMPNSTEKAVVEYSPFVMQVNPNSGGRSIAPTITGISNMTKYFMDYRRTFNYYNFFGNHKSGVLGNPPSSADLFLALLWDKYAENRGINPNYGSKDPLSYYNNTGNLGLPLAYVDPNGYNVVVNSNRWTANGEPANGAMIGQITFSSDISTINNGGSIFPIILWFDTKF